MCLYVIFALKKTKKINKKDTKSAHLNRDGNRQLPSYLPTRKCPTTAKNAVGCFSVK